MTLIDTVYIHNSGGKALLKVLIKKILKNNLNSFFFLFDSRLDTPLISKLAPENFMILKASEYNRTVFYKKKQNLFNHFFCFANVPPSVQLKKPVTIYFHNDLILDSKNSGIGLVQRVKFQLKKKYIQLINNKHYQWVVQTALMEEKLKNEFKINSKNISVLPFFDNLIPLSKTVMIPDTFLYVANYTNNKNHKKLIQAFQQASFKTNKNFTLKLTLGVKEFKFLMQDLDYSKTNFELINLGVLGKKTLVEAYQEANFFIYPSLKESFGLPLIEATNFSGYILASDLAYVNEVINPSLTFNPHVTSEITTVILNVLNLRKLKVSKSKVFNQIDDLMTHITRSDV